MKRTNPKRGFTLLELGLVMAMIAILAAIMFPVFTRAQQAAHKSQCAANLVQIGMALQLYARDHDSRMPPRHNDLGPLLRGYVTDPGLLECGSDPAAPAIRRANEARHEGQRAYSSYQYRGGLSAEDLPDRPLASDWTQRHDAGANLLVVSGRVKFYRTTNLPPVSYGPPVMPPGAPAPSSMEHTPYLNAPAPPAKTLDAGGMGE